MFRRILIANRGEIALRIIRAAKDLDVESVSVYSKDEASAAHPALATQAVSLAGSGPGAYLQIDELIRIAQAHDCDAVHPGYGFLSERADFASACTQAGLKFIGPTPRQLALFGDKAAARALAVSQNVPLMPGSQGAVTLEEAQAFFAAQNGAGIMIKAIGGGGGRGMRAVAQSSELAEAYARCTSEARSAFGVDGVYVERLMARARHIEIQILGDGHDVISLGERECSLQRRFQKLVEIAPSPRLAESMRLEITAAALKLASAVKYEGLGTFEFLVEEGSADLPWVFIEANPRLQVEHTVTEEVTGLDLVQLQIAVAAGSRLSDLGLDAARPPEAKGFAIQWRINAETLMPDGTAKPSSGTLDRFDMPSGLGVRVETHGRTGNTPSPHYDSLLAKLICTSKANDFPAAARRATRALSEVRIEGVATNLALLQALAIRPEFVSQDVHTRYVEEHLAELLEQADKIQPAAGQGRSLTGRGPSGAARSEFDLSDKIAIRAPMAAKLVQCDVSVGDILPLRSEVAVLEAMKMEHVLHAQRSGKVIEIRKQAGDLLAEGDIIVLLEPAEVGADASAESAEVDPDHIRADLQRVIDRHAHTLDESRPRAVETRHGRGGRMARENIAQLCAGGEFLEYGALALAAQKQRRSLDDLIQNTPADGLITGLGTVNEAEFGEEASRCAVMSYDYTVLAGTQGMRNHQKTDRLLDVAHRLSLPFILFAEGGGGRPGDTDMPIIAGLHLSTFAAFAKLNGKVPVLGIVSGRCFAGNAALLGCCDVIIATKDSNIGMGGPVMIEGGGLGTFAPEEIGPSGVQHHNGVIDILVKDETEAVEKARKYISYFQGRCATWEAPDARGLRHLVPENRLRAYDTRAAVEGIADVGSVTWLRTGFGTGIHTALIRIEGRPVGVIANNPLHLGGAIDADAADKAARFMQLCNAHKLPMISLIDTPGFMVGPEIEEKAQVRHVSRLFISAAHLRVPFFSVVLRKGYGLGAMGVAAGGFHSPVFIVSWPTGEFGGMGLEGSVRLGFRKELEAVPEGAERDALFNKLVAQQYEAGGAINMAATLEIDAVIDPASTRDWLARGLARSPACPDEGIKAIDTW
ncbi:MAG: carboxyl transferase domain-containing protein [Ottowia sp.]|uniref:acetyl-CoA carboxylase family protein n=1 Tax=Ottowia sp. TaxID=1898956 RepID=UPI003C7581B6